MEIGPLQEIDKLECLFQLENDFIDKLKADKELQQVLMNRFRDGANHTVPASIKVDEALKNRLDFEVCQLSRAILCVSYLTNESKKKQVSHDVFVEFSEALELAQKWKRPQRE